MGNCEENRLLERHFVTLDRSNLVLDDGIVYLEQVVIGEEWGEAQRLS